MLTKNVSIQELKIGKNNPVRVESMLKVPISMKEQCMDQLEKLSSRKCELVRAAFPSMDLKNHLSEIVKRSPIPVMADIHFDHKLALAAIEAGCKAIRINPGNMGPVSRLRSVIDSARDHHTVIRIGANSGSINTSQLKEAEGDVGKALFIAVQEQIRSLLDNSFEEIIISAKSTDVIETVRSNVLLSQKYPEFPFHIGITEAGPGFRGITKSAVGLSILLSQGIGDTMRVSLTGKPELEVDVAYEILRSNGLRHIGPEIISCPTCGRKRIDVEKVVNELEPFFNDLPDGFKVAVMGCEVNGPREAINADIGIAGTPHGFVIFEKGKIIEQCGPENIKDILSCLLQDYKSDH